MDLFGSVRVVNAWKEAWGVGVRGETDHFSMFTAFSTHAVIVHVSDHKFVGN